MKKVVVIGAGPAGLTAAYELLERPDEYEVVILEESGSIGGISRTVCHNGHRMDIGGHRFFSKDERVVRWWNKMMPLQGAPSYDDKVLRRRKPLAAGGPDPEREDRVMLVRRRVSRIYYRKRFFDYPISMKMETIKNMGLLTTLQAGVSYAKAALLKRPEDSLENFYINRFGKKLYSMFFEGYTEKLWGRHPREISADWGSQRVKGLSVLEVLRDMAARMLPGQKKRKVETSLIEEFTYPKFGPGQLWETVAEEIKRRGGTICMHSKVTGIQIQDQRISSVTYERDGETRQLDGDLFLSSMPVKDLVEAMGDVVPERQALIAAGLPYRDFVTVGILTDRLNLNNETKMRTLNNLVPDCWIYVQDTGVKLGRIQIFNNWSPYLVRDPEHTVWIGLEYFCNEGDDFWNMGDRERSRFAVGELLKMGVIRRDQKILDYHVEKVKKAYPAYFDTYAQMQELVEYLDGFGNLYCIGRNGQHRYNNMDHSMATAFEAVDNIVHNRTEKNNIWNVNTEKQYHERA